jgi:hypothetical protein
MNVEIGTQAAQFPGKEYIKGFLLQCGEGPGGGGEGGTRADLTKLGLSDWYNDTIQANLLVLLIHLANNRIGERNWRESSTLSWRSLWIETSTGIPDTID